LKEKCFASPLLEMHCPFATVPCLDEIHVKFLQSVGPVDPSFRALSERLKFTVRRHKVNKDSFLHSSIRPEDSAHVGAIVLALEPFASGPGGSMRRNHDENAEHVGARRAPWEPMVPPGIGRADSESHFVDFKRAPPPPRRVNYTLESVARPTNTSATKQHQAPAAECGGTTCSSLPGPLTTGDHSNWMSSMITL